MESSSKRKRPDISEEVPEERLLKKFEVLESHLMQLWETDSNRESLESLDTSVADIVSFVDDQLDHEEDVDRDDEHYNNNGENYNDENFVEEVPRESTPVEEIDLSDEELTNIWENSPRPVKETAGDEDVVFLKEDITKENGLFSHSSALHPDIRETWTVWTRAGIPLKDREELLKKYAPPKFLKTPEINPEILVTLHKRPIDKDEFVRSSQELVSSALTALGSVMSSLLTENDYDKLKVLNSLNDTAKLLTYLFHFDTDKRRSNIISWKSKPVQNLLAGTRPDEFLFGKNLSGKIEQAQKAGRIKLKPYVFKKTNNRPYRNYASPYHWYGDEEKDDKDFVLNPQHKETKFICKMENIDKHSIKLE